MSCLCATDGDIKYQKERDDMKIPVAKETYHTQCQVFVSNRCWYQIPKGERHHNTSRKRNTSYTMCRGRVQQMVIPNTERNETTWKYQQKEKHIIHNVSLSCATDGDTKYLKERDITIPVVIETYHAHCVVFVCNIWWYQLPKGERHHNTSSNRTYHTHCVMFLCNIWWYQIPKGERRHDNTSSEINLAYIMCHVRVQQMVISTT